MARPLQLLLFLLIAVTGFTKLASAGGIDIVREKIERYEGLSSSYAAAASQFSGNSDALSSFKYVDTKEQFCMVLIDLLGLNPGDSAQSVHPDPGPSSQDAEELARYSLSLKSYVIAAQSLLQQDVFSWRYKWNLNCSGVFGAYKYIRVTDDPPYSVRVSEDRQTLSVVGDIEEGLLNVIAKRLAIHRSIKRVELSSAGGLIYEGLKIGRLLRKRKITTVVEGNCLSSCAFIFLGGAERIIPAPYWTLGFHRASEQGTPVWDGDDVYEKVRVYINEMIGSGDELVRRTLIPIGLDFYRPSRKEMCDRKIATSVEGICDK